MDQFVKGLENNAEETMQKGAKADILKILYILKIFNPAESPLQVFRLESDTIKFVLWMGALGQCGKRAVAEDEKATRDRETHWAVVKKLQARSKEVPKEAGAGRLKSRLVGC